MCFCVNHVLSTVVLLQKGQDVARNPLASALEGVHFGLQRQA